MKRITIYRNPDCARCAKIARTHKFFDWLGRVDCSTTMPKSGPLALGEIVVEDNRTGEITRGVNAVRKIFRQISAYWPLLPFLRIPSVAGKVEKDVRGCSDGSCASPPPWELREAGDSAPPKEMAKSRQAS
jgi:hypothetical protein